MLAAGVVRLGARHDDTKALVRDRRCKAGSAAARQEVAHNRDGLAVQRGGTHVRAWHGIKELLLDPRASVRPGEPAGHPAGPLGPPNSRSRPGRSGFLRRPLLAVVALAAAGALAAGCGSNGSGSGGYGSGGSGASATTAGGKATVAAASSKLGTILVDGSGRTLYLFEKDQPNQSACAGACAAAWPADQSSGNPTAGSGVKASLLGTIHRSDGSTQVTYNHHPLYYYSGDSGAGQENGQGVSAFGATWFVVGPTGDAVSGATATTAANGGYGG
jgi:predicted lipoprotein with Yx(FWY)xxD motif